VKAIRTMAIVNCAVTRMPLKDDLTEDDSIDFFRLSTAFELEIFHAGIRLNRALKTKVQAIELIIKPGE
jgi:hypothetical protein